MNVILQQPTPDVAFVTRLRFLLFEQKDGARLAYLVNFNRKLSLHISLICF